MCLLVHGPSKSIPAVALGGLTSYSSFAIVAVGGEEGAQWGSIDTQHVRGCKMVREARELLVEKAGKSSRMCT
jgi:hypothetical protein